MNYILHAERIEQPGMANGYKYDLLQITDLKEGYLYSDAIRDGHCITKSKKKIILEGGKVYIRLPRERFEIGTYSE